MLKANIGKEKEERMKRRAVYETLTESEIRNLRGKTIGHGNMARCEDSTHLTRNTIMRAMQGGRIVPKNAAAIRLYLAGQPVTEETINTFLKINNDEAGTSQA
jgi:hypothetical protein